MEPSRKDTAEHTAEEYGESGWVTTDVAAGALGVTPRTVRAYIRSGRLEAESRGEGVNKTWLVSMSTVQKLREARNLSKEGAKETRSADTTDTSAENTPVKAAEAFRELITRLEARTAEAASLRVRLELTAQAESTVREESERLRVDLEKERERADRLEEELRQVRRGWFRRFFGF